MPVGARAVALAATLLRVIVGHSLARKCGMLVILWAKLLRCGAAAVYVLLVLILDKPPRTFVFQRMRR